MNKLIAVLSFAEKKFFRAAQYGNISELKGVSFLITCYNNNIRYYLIVGTQKVQYYNFHKYSSLNIFLNAK